MVFAVTLRAWAVEPGALETQGYGQLTLQHDAPQRGRPANLLVLRVRLDAAAQLTPELAAVGLARLLPVLPQQTGANRPFANEGILAEEAFLHWQRDGLTARIGKFSPDFGRAWYLAPGIFGDRYAGDAQIIEQLGAEISYAIALPGGGQHALSLADTMADRSPLSQTLITDRGRLRLADGGPSNTTAPRSLTIAYDAARLPLADGHVSLHTAFAQLGRGQGDPAQERLAVAAVDTEHPGPAGSTVRTLAEAVHRIHPDGQPGWATIVTLSGELNQGSWHADITVATRDQHTAPVIRRDRMVAAGLRHEIGENISVAGGYMFERTGSTAAHAVAHTVAIELTYSFQHCRGCSVLGLRHY